MRLFYLLGFQHFRPAVGFVLIFTLIYGVIYPVFCTGLLQTFFPYQANGSPVIDKEGVSVGSELIGQAFSDPRYFWGRLSATPSYPYNASASAGSQFSPANPALRAAAETRLKELREADPTQADKPAPSDLVTASGSGLDPHISPEAAAYQIGRVARARGMTPEAVSALVEKYTEPPAFGFLGRPRVHVLKLNLALDGRI